MQKKIRGAGNVPKGDARRDLRDSWDENRDGAVLKAAC